LSKGLTGGNRLKEEREAQSPSCRICHSNSLYIEEENMAAFKELFVNCDRECGRCHKGIAWRGQFGGHIFRRFMGGRWDKENGNKLCNSCHADRSKMAEVEISDEKTGKRKKAKAPFILATKSYNMTLHSKLVMMKEEMGASCIDCHSPDGFKHNVRKDSDPHSSTHEENLAATCGQKKCHPYAGNPLNKEFIRTTMHSLDFPAADKEIAPVHSGRLHSNWFRIAAVLAPLALFTMVLNFGWSILIRKKGKQWPILGGDSFQIKMLKRIPKSKKEKMKSSQGKKLRSLIILLFLLYPAISKADNLYIEMVDKATIDVGKVHKIKEKLEKHKKVEPLSLNLKPYHKRVEPLQESRLIFCNNCHGKLPHKKEAKTRTFLNMHTHFATCKVCHFIPEGVEIKKSWLNFDKPNKKIDPFIKGEPQSLFENHPFAQEVKKKLETITIKEKAELVFRLHSPLSKEKIKCSACHSEKQKFLDLEALRFDEKKQNEIERSSIVRFMERLKKDESISLKALGR